MTDEVFEQRLRRDLRRLADHLVAPSDASTAHVVARTGLRSRRSRRGRRALRMVVGRWVLVAACLVAAGAVAGRATARPGPSSPAGTGPGTLSGAKAALAETSGAMAFVASGSLYVAGPGSLPHAVAAVGQARSAPQWSADGRWVAYLGPGERLHVVRPGGGPSRLVAPVPVTAMSWSPAADLLAVVPAAGPDRGRVEVVAVTAGAGPLAPAAADVVSPPASSFVWSADGRQIAYARAGRGAARDRLAVVDVVTGATTPLAYQAPPGTGVQLAGWWPDGGGLLFWLDPGRSPAAEATGLELWSLPLGSATAVAMARTFVYLPWLAWAPNGRLLALVEQSSAFPWQGSTLAVCDPASGSCRSLAQPAGSVSVDPAWSPDGRRLAFVRAPVLPSAAPGAGLDSWYQQRRLWVSDASGAAARAVPGAPGGVAAPRFGPNGRTLSAVTGRSVVEVPVRSGRATTVASDLAGALGTAGPDGYGKLPWGGTVAWGA